MLIGYTNICKSADTHTASEHSPCPFNPTVHKQNLLRFTQLHLGKGDGQVKSLWVRIKSWAGVGDTVVGV